MRQNMQDRENMRMGHAEMAGAQFSRTSRWYEKPGIAYLAAGWIVACAIVIVVLLA